MYYVRLKLHLIIFLPYGFSSLFIPFVQLIHLRQKIIFPCFILFAFLFPPAEEPLSPAYPELGSEAHGLQKEPFLSPLYRPLELFPSTINLTGLLNGTVILTKYIPSSPPPLEPYGLLVWFTVTASTYVLSAYARRDVTRTCCNN